jgi:hypothetical protein
MDAMYRELEIIPKKMKQKQLEIFSCAKNIIFYVTYF